MDGLEWGWNSTFSRGPGYEPTPIGPSFSISSVDGYFIDFSAKTRASSADHPELLLPAALAQLGLGWWERSLTGSALAYQSFEWVCQVLRASSEETPDDIRWPYHVSVPKYRLSPPWYSALAQGQIASLFVRAYLRTGDDQYEHLARCAVKSLIRVEGSDLVTVTPAGPILEESPSNPPGHILNGWISALWGLWDVHVGLDDDEAGEAFNAGIACLLRHLDAYDIGWWTRYSLYPHPIEDLAKPIYHVFHAHQVDVLHRLTGVDDFGDAARRWREYDTLPNRARAVAQKAVFTATRIARERSARAD